MSKFERAKASLEKLNWPPVVHSTEFKCDKESVPEIAKKLGYRERPCPSTPDGIWRNKDGSLKTFVLYERVR